jgi:hypothetical protein
MLQDRRSGRVFVRLDADYSKAGGAPHSYFFTYGTLIGVGKEASQDRPWCNLPRSCIAFQVLIPPWNTLSNAFMCSGIIVITQKFIYCSFQLTLVQYQHLIQTLSFQTSHEPFTYHIRPWSPKRSLHLLDS